MAGLETFSPNGQDPACVVCQQKSLLRDAILTHCKDHIRKSFSMMGIVCITIDDCTHEHFLKINQTWVDVREETYSGQQAKAKTADGHLLSNKAKSKVAVVKNSCCQTEMNNMETESSESHSPSQLENLYCMEQMDPCRSPASSVMGQSSMTSNRRSLSTSVPQEHDTSAKVGEQSSDTDTMPRTGLSCANWSSSESYMLQRSLNVLSDLLPTGNSDVARRIGEIRTAVSGNRPRPTITEKEDLVLPSVSSVQVGGTACRSSTTSALKRRSEPVVPVPDNAIDSKRRKSLSMEQQTNDTKHSRAKTVVLPLDCRIVSVQKGDKETELSVVKDNIAQNGKMKKATGANVNKLKVVQGTEKSTGANINKGNVQNAEKSTGANVNEGSVSPSKDTEPAQTALMRAAKEKSLMQDHQYQSSPGRSSSGSATSVTKKTIEVVRNVSPAPRKPLGARTGSVITVQRMPDTEQKGKGHIAVMIRPADGKSDSQTRSEKVTSAAADKLETQNTTSMAVGSHILSVQSSKVNIASKMSSGHTVGVGKSRSLLRQNVGSSSARLHAGVASVGSKCAPDDPKLDQEPSYTGLLPETMAMGTIRIKNAPTLKFKFEDETPVEGGRQDKDKERQSGVLHTPKEGSQTVDGNPSLHAARGSSIVGSTKGKGIVPDDSVTRRFLELVSQNAMPVLAGGVTSNATSSARKTESTKAKGDRSAPGMGTGTTVPQGQDSTRLLRSNTSPPQSSASMQDAASDTAASTRTKKVKRRYRTSQKAQVSHTSTRLRPILPKPPNYSDDIDLDSGTSASKMGLGKKKSLSPKRKPPSASRRSTAIRVQLKTSSEKQSKATPKKKKTKWPKKKSEGLPSWYNRYEQTKSLKLSCPSAEAEKNPDVPFSLICQGDDVVSNKKKNQNPQPGPSEAYVYPNVDLPKTCNVTVKMENTEYSSEENHASSASAVLDFANRSTAADARGNVHIIGSIHPKQEPLQEGYPEENLQSRQERSAQNPNSRHSSPSKGSVVHGLEECRVLLPKMKVCMDTLEVII